VTAESGVVGGGDAGAQDSLDGLENHVRASITSTAKAAVENARRYPIERVIRDWRIQLRGKIERVGPCPICGGCDRFSINIRKQKWNCRGCRKGGRDAISLVRFIDGRDFGSSVAVLAGHGPVGIGADKPNTKSTVTDPRCGGADQYWHRLWKKAGSPYGTLVERYLARRHLTLPADAGDCIRFHPRCPFGKDDEGETIYTPAMVALVRNVVSNEPQGIHRTAIDLSGRKAKIGGDGRMALGPTAGGAIKLTANEKVIIAIGIGEGIETTLSLQRIPEWAASPVWSLINDRGMENFPVLAGIETLVVAVDHDEAGENAALAVAERWRAAARQMLLFEAVNPDNDLNDVISDE
jgi:Toprim domain